MMAFPRRSLVPAALVSAATICFTLPATGQTVERVAKDVDRDYIMEPDQAVSYGMIDRVITSRDLVPIAIKS